MISQTTITGAKEIGSRAVQLRFFLLIVFSLFCSPIIAGSINTPDSSRPGAVRPEAGDIVGVKTADVVLKQGLQNNIDIPAVIDRPFDIEEGPFVLVDNFRLLDAEEMPEYGVSLAELESMVLGPRRRSQPDRGFSIGELQEVADEVTQYYRSKGLIVTTAVLPVQTVTDGTVDIEVLIGRLGRVLVESNDKYNVAVLSKPFAGLIGEPITQSGIEGALLTLTDYPGLSVFGVFQPGLRVSEADIILKVQEEKHYDVAYRVDNHGVQTTGRNRFRTTIDWNNPTGLADKITASYQQTYNPKKNNFWSLDYEIFLGRGYTLGIGAFHNEFDIGGQFASSRISAESQNYQFYIGKSFIRSRQQNLSTKVSLTQKRSTTTTFSAIQTSTDRLAVLDLELNYDSVDNFHPLRHLLEWFKDGEAVVDNIGGGLNFATLNYSRGFNDIFGALGSNGEQQVGLSGSRSSRRGASGRLAEGQFDKLTGRYQRLQLMTKNQSLLFRTEFQWSNDLLAPLEQYAVGGPENVRGFPDAQGLFDRAYFFSLEYIINAPFIAERPAFGNRTWGEVLQFSVFYDFATAKQNDAVKSPQDPNTSGQWITFKSIGMGLRFTLPGSFSSRLMYATELGPDIPNDGRFGHIWADFTYSF